MIAIGMIWFPSLTLCSSDATESWSLAPSILARDAFCPCTSCKWKRYSQRNCVLKSDTFLNFENEVRSFSVRRNSIRYSIQFCPTKGPHINGVSWTLPNTRWFYIRLLIEFTSRISSRKWNCLWWLDVGRRIWRSNSRSSTWIWQ